MEALAAPLRLLVDASRAAVAERTGTERYSYELLGALAAIDRQNQYELAVPRLPVDLPPLGSNFRLRHLPAPRLWTHLRLGPYAARSRPSLLFVPSHTLPLIGSARQVVTIHDLGYLFFPEAHPLARRRELDLTTRWSLRRATRVIAISEATRQALIACYGGDPERIRVVHHGVSSTFAPAPPAAIAAAKAAFAIEGRYFLYVGTLQPRKNLPRLLAAYRAAFPNDDGPLLLIGGRLGWLSDDLARQIAALGLGKRVRLLGYLPDAALPALISGARAFLFASLYEGFGMPVLEAMACGTPVLTSTTSALPEVAGEAALLVDPHDTEAMATQLQRLASDDHLCADLRARGLAHAATFSWEGCARETLAVLREAAAG